MASENRLSEYFAEMDAIAQTDPVKAKQLLQDHMRMFVKISDVMDVSNQTNMIGFSSSQFTSISTDCFSGIFIMNGEAMDWNGNPIDLDDEDQPWNNG